MGMDFTSFAEEDKQQKKAVVENQKQSDEKILVGIYMTKEQKRLIKVAAAAKDESVSAFVCRAIDRALSY